MKLTRSLSHKTQTKNVTQNKSHGKIWHSYHFALFPYHVLSINKRIIDSHDFDIIPTGCNSQNQSPNPSKPCSNKNKVLTHQENCIRIITSSIFDSYSWCDHLTELSKNLRYVQDLIRR